MFQSAKKEKEQNISVLVDTLKLMGHSMNWLADILTYDKTEGTKCSRSANILICDKMEGAK
jgi:hypothetical protein